MSAAVMAGPRSAEVIVDERGFEQLEEQWDRLVSSCASSTPFQAHAWLSAWWRCYGTPGQLRVVVVHEGPELVAAVALFLRRRHAARVLSPVGIGLSDFCDVLIADSVRDERAELVHALASALVEMAGWDVIDLPEVRPGAAALDLAASWPGSSSVTSASTCLELPVRDLHSLIEDLPRANSTVRSRRRAKLRRIDEVGVTSREVPAYEVPAAISEFHRLHLAQWEGRGISAAHTTPRFRRFLAEALPLMVQRGQAVVVEFRVAGTVMAIAINLAGQALLGEYLAGAAPVLRNQLEVSTLLLRQAMDLARQRDAPVLSFLRGLEDYKLRWRPEHVRNRRVVLGRPSSLRATTHVGALQVWARARPWLRTHAPWLKALSGHAGRH